MDDIFRSKFVSLHLFCLPHCTSSAWHASVVYKFYVFIWNDLFQNLYNWMKLIKLGCLDLPFRWKKHEPRATAPGSVAGLRWPGHGRRTAGLLGEASTNQIPSSSSLHQSEASYCHVGDCHWSTVHSPLSRDGENREHGSKNSEL